VLIDIGLPGGDPEQLLTRIASLPTATRPVVLVVASNPAAARSLDVDVVQIVLRRPLSLRQTVDVIRSCVENTLARPDDADGSGKGDQLIS
jgi:CheY-like chemotaxis protein